MVAGLQLFRCLLFKWILKNVWMTLMNNSVPEISQGKLTKLSHFRRWGKYAAFAAFMFFLLKGIGWLVLFGLAVWGFSS
tara:strand:- start:38 stop:274 length:237 start_codon:yes stop_codon:yes gene_type:complete